MRSVNIFVSVENRSRRESKQLFTDKSDLIMLYRIDYISPFAGIEVMQRMATGTGFVCRCKSNIYNSVQSDCCCNDHARI